MGYIEYDGNIENIYGRMGFIVFGLGDIIGIDQQHDVLCDNDFKSCLNKR